MTLPCHECGHPSAGHVTDVAEVGPGVTDRGHLRQAYTPVATVFLCEDHLRPVRVLTEMEITPEEWRRRAAHGVAVTAQGFDSLPLSELVPQACDVCGEVATMHGCDGVEDAPYADDAGVAWETQVVALLFYRCDDHMRQPRHVSADGTLVRPANCDYRRPDAEKRANELYPAAHPEATCETT